MRRVNGGGTVTVPAGQAALCPGAGQGGATLPPVPCTAPRLLCRLCPALEAVTVHHPMHTGSNSLPWPPEGETGTRATLAAAAASPWYLSQGTEKDVPMLYKLNTSVPTGSYSGACVRGQ